MGYQPMRTAQCHQPLLMSNPIEFLERRRLLAGTSDFAELEDGVLRVSGTGADDAISISFGRGVASSVVVRLNGDEEDLGPLPSNSIRRVLIRAGSGDDRIRSSLPVPTTFDGGAGDDTLLSSPGKDLLLGGVGNDFIRASVSRDVVDGGPGNDSVPFRNGVYAEFGGVVVQFAYEGTLRVAATAQGDQVRVSIPGPSETGGQPVRLSINGRGRSLSDPRFSTPPRARRVAVFAGAGSDHVRLRSSDPTLRPTLHGGRGNDTLIGSDFADELRGDAGNDNIVALGGPDVVLGGNGHDRLDLGLGRDTANAGTGDDRIFNFNPDVTQDFDQLRGGPGEDTAQGDEKDQYLDAIEHVVPFDA